MLMSPFSLAFSPLNFCTLKFHAITVLIAEDQFSEKTAATRMKVVIEARRQVSHEFSSHNRLLNADE